MNCVLCFTVVIKEEGFGEYNTKPQVCKKTIVKLFHISGDPDVQRLSEDLVICSGCRQKLEGVEVLVTHLEELQREVDKAKIIIKQWLIVSDFMAKDFEMSKSTMDRLVLLKAIEGTGNGRPPGLDHDGIDVRYSNEYGYFEVQQSDQVEPEIPDSTKERHQLLPIGATMESEVNISFQIPPGASTINHEEKSHPIPSNSKAGALKNPKAAPKTTTVVEEVSIEGYGSESAFEDDNSSEVGTDGESGTSTIITSNGVKPKRAAPGSTIKEFILLGSGSFECKVCSSIITNKKGLSMHLLIHEPRRIKCTFQNCGKMFGHKSVRDRHVKNVHEKRRDFKCTWTGCEKMFSTSSIRDSHVKTVHEGRRDFKCGVRGCDKSFTTKWHLQRHMLMSPIHRDKIIKMSNTAKKKGVEEARVISPEVIIPDLKVEEFYYCRITP